MKKSPEGTVPLTQAPLFETLLASSGPGQAVVNGSGLVRPRRLAQLVPEISGRDRGWIHSFPPDALDFPDDLCGSVFPHGLPDSGTELVLHFAGSG